MENRAGADGWQAGLIVKYQADKAHLITKAGSDSLQYVVIIPAYDMTTADMNTAVSIGHSTDAFRLIPFASDKDAADDFCNLMNGD